MNMEHGNSLSVRKLLLEGGPAAPDLPGTEQVNPGAGADIAGGGSRVCDDAEVVGRADPRKPV